MHILSAKNVNKSFSNHVALRDVTIEIPKQSIFGLLGPNGAGKSTFIRIVNQIINADSGDIRINDQPLKPDHIRTIGYLPEERGLYKKMKVGEQLLYLTQLRGLSKKDATKRSKQWLEKFEAGDWWNKKVEDLSKGMQQKVQFIATVLHEPELIILDEPFSGFDPINANIIKDEILELREKGSTIIFSTHRMESVEELCDHIALINKSEKILDGKKSQIKQDFKQNIYSIKHTGASLNANGLFEVITDEKLEGDDATHSRIRLLEGNTSKDLLKQLIAEDIHITHFEEETPSINDIFIQLVQERKTPQPE